MVLVVVVVVVRALSSNRLIGFKDEIKNNGIIPLSNDAGPCSSVSPSV